jgi:RNA polymerase sigma factor (sigma-70 family)
LGRKSKIDLNLSTIFASKQRSVSVLNNNHLSNTYESFSDEQLVDLFVRKNQRVVAFSEIMNRYNRKVYYHVRNMLPSHDDADDAAQNTFVKVWENLEKFKGESKLYSWIYRIATNEALTILRRIKPNVSLDDVLPETITNGPQSSESADSISMKLGEAMSMLPLKQKLVFYLRYFEDLSYAQISEITETSEGALKASYFHAVKKIEQHLERII